MSKINFPDIVAEIVDQLEKTSKTNPSEITSCKSGEDFEVVVQKAAEQVKIDKGYDFSINYQKGSHRFPDIILEFDNGDKYGIEVKSSTSETSNNWKINGNSIVGSTKDSDVIETYIIFGKTKQLKFRSRRYAECVADIAVTHSPRYMIDMDLTTKDNFFAKSGIPYEELSSSSSPIERITSYYRGIGKQAWWIADEVPATVIKWTDLSDEEQDKCYAYIFAHFPEVFLKDDKTKYDRTRSWLIAAKSAFALRDIFSAGGQNTIKIGRTTYQNVPHIYSVLIEHKDAVNSILSAGDSSLFDDWKFLDKALRKPQNYKNTWIKLVVQQMDTDFLNGQNPEVFIKGIIG